MSTQSIKLVNSELIVKAADKAFEKTIAAELSQEEKKPTAAELEKLLKKYGSADKELG